MTEEMPAIHREFNVLHDMRRQTFEPVGRIARQGDIERDDILHGARMNRALANHRAANGEAVEKRRRAFFGRAFEVVAHLRREARLQIGARLLHAVVTHLQQQMMLEPIAVFDEPARVRIETRRRRCSEIMHMLAVLVIGREPPGGGRNIAGKFACIQTTENGFGGVAQTDAKVIDEFQFALRRDAHVDRQLSNRGAAANQGAARVIADAARHRSANATGADHRMQFAPERLKTLLQLIQRRLADRSAARHCGSHPAAAIACR